VIEINNLKLTLPEPYDFKPYIIIRYGNKTQSSKVIKDSTIENGTQICQYNVPLRIYTEMKGIKNQKLKLYFMNQGLGNYAVGICQLNLALTMNPRGVM